MGRTEQRTEQGTEKRRRSSRGEPAKRGRGRPRIENPLSPAERARRYRDRKRCERANQARQGSRAAVKKEGAAARVTNNDAAQLALLKSRIDELERSAEARERQLGDLAGALHEVVLVASAGKRIPPYLLKGLVKLLAR